MNIEEYRRRAAHLYQKYLLLQQNNGIVTAVKIPQQPRPYYRTFKIIVDLAQGADEVTTAFDDMKSLALAERAEFIDHLNKKFPRKAFVSDGPTDSRGHRKNNLYKDIEKADLALEVYRKHSNGQKWSEIVLEVDGDYDEKAARKKFDKHIGHATKLIEAARIGNFYEALTSALPRNK